MDKVLAYLLDEDCTQLPVDAPAGLLALPALMRPGGRLDYRRPSLPGTATPGALLVVAREFLGRSEDGRLGFLCDVVDGTNGPAAAG